MALQGPIPVSFDMVFPHGCYLVGEVEAVKDFDASTNGRFVQARDKQSGELVWQIAVMDADPQVKPAQKTVAVKIIAPVQPVPPAPVTRHATSSPPPQTPPWSSARPSCKPPPSSPS
jgi:hypothetical protein